MFRTLVGGNALDLHDEFDVFARSQNGNEIISLEHETDLVQSEISEFALVKVIDALPGDPNLAAVRPVQATNCI